MKKIENVKKISLFLVGKQNKIIGEVELPILNKDNVELPINFNYNGDCEMKHICSNCNNQISVSMQRKETFPFDKYHNLNFFSTVYDSDFTLQILEDINEILCDVVLIKEEGYTLISSKKSVENNFPMSISISFHKCNICNTHYLSHFYNSSGFVEERNGKITLPQLTFVEIVSIEINENEDAFLKKLSFA